MLTVVGLPDLKLIDPDGHPALVIVAPPERMKSLALASTIWAVYCGEPAAAVTSTREKSSAALDSIGCTQFFFLYVVPWQEQNA